MTLLFMYAESGAESPLWNADGHMVWLEQLDMDQALATKVANWASRFDDEGLEDDWYAEGLALFGELNTALASMAKVVWQQHR